MVPEALVIAGYSGRNRNAVEAHIAELEQSGIRRPTSIPCFFTASPELLSQECILRTTVPNTSGEVEFALISHEGERYVAVASDHTDRGAETLDLALSKRVCPKMVGSEAWRLDEISSHWDALLLRSWIESDRGRLKLYQSGSVAELLSPADLLRAIPWRRLPASFVVLGGTIPTATGLLFSDRFRGELVDSSAGRSLTLDYQIAVSSHLRE
jgi:hypothetical protein